MVNLIAPEDRRAELVSNYFIWVFCGNAVPVIGVGVLSTLASSTVASAAFAAMIVAFALVALSFSEADTRAEGGRAMRTGAITATVPVLGRNQCLEVT